MSERRYNLSIEFDPETGTYHISNASGNPLYSQDLQLATEMARIDVIDKSVTEWIDCVDAEAIWQDMKRSVDTDPK